MTHQPAKTANPKAVAPATAVLVLDESGRIQLADQGACTLWQAKSSELNGDLFPNLFSFEVISKDESWVQAQWEVLVAAASEETVPLKLQPKEAAAFDVTLRIEKASDDPLCFFAHIARPAPVSHVTAPPPADTQDSLINLLNERSPLGFFDLNFVKSEVFYSPAWKRMLGYDDSALESTYESWVKLIHPEDTGAAPDRRGRGTSTGLRSFSVEYRMQHAAGHYVWVQGVGVQQYGPNGALQRVVGAHIEIQDRKEFEEAGLRAEERLQHLGEDARLGIFDLDFAENRFWYSPAFKSLLGIPESDNDASDKVFLDSLPADETGDGLAAWFLKQHTGEPAFSEPVRLRHRGGRDVDFQIGVVRILARKSELQRVVGYLIPLPSSGTAAPFETGQPTAHLATLLGEMHEGALFADINGIIQYANPKAANLLNLALDKITGQHVAEIFRPYHRTTGQPGENPFDKVLTTGEPVPLNDEFALDRGNGKPAPVTFHCQPVADNSGSAIGAVLIFRNPDELSLTPEELIRANRFDALGQLAGGIAHDFNNLLTTILGGVSLAKDNRDSSGLENSERACLAAKALSKQLLTFAKGGTSVRQVVKPADILADAVRLAAAGSVVKVESNVAPDIDPFCVDRAQILQVFQNLIINAIQAMPSGQGNIWINAANVQIGDGEIPPLAAGKYVAVEVRDDGSGISPENIEKIFSPFFTTKKTGTGLGLATVLSIVKRHGGQLCVDSEIGTGTTFTIFIPPAEQEVEVEARRAPSLRFGTGRVLFMDDDVEICQLTGAMLDGLGYKYDIAKNGDEAIKFYKRYLNIGRPYDAVIMDLTIIGGMGGEECFKHLRELDADVRAIIASGYDNDEMARQYLDMGFYGYLTKPYRAADLGRVIKSVCGG